ncbi:MAG: helix-turn-helix domain-containing protein [Pirellulaceae bacterium]|nr:helix-turn-helix domain-containing protein [Pirellulaceae bacterium]
MTTIVGHVRTGFLDRMAQFSLPAIAVWLALANRADKDCGCFPSITAIRKATGLARATVCKAIAELVGKGEIIVTPGGGKGNPSNHYQIVGSPENELVQSVNQFKRRAKVVRRLNSNQTQEPDDRARKRFVIPTLGDVSEYCRERGNSVDPQRFIDHYESNGWRVGRNAMKDWRAAVRTWERNGFADSNGKPKPEPIQYRD